MIAAEDKRFFRHGGVDYLAVLRAAARNLAAGRVVTGGSTIPLQLARLLRPAPRTLPAKMQEVFTAWRLEAGMTKEKILAEYLNRVPMGGNLYGIEAASRSYFGIGADQLSLAQATFLAALPNSPTSLNPFRNRDGVRERQRYILDRMIGEGYIDRSRRGPALQEHVSLHPQASSFLAPHFVFSLMERLPARSREVTTTIDSHIQRLALHEAGETVRSLRGRRVTNAAVMVVQNFSAEVLAYVGSVDFFDAAKGGMNDGVRARRQPGSTLKPFLYALAFDRGYTPASLIADTPLSLPMPAGVFQPQNYGEVFLGPVRARVSLSNSLNVPAVRLVSALGVDAFLDTLQDFGFDSLDRPADHYGAGLALGDGEVTLYELAGAYRTLAAGGADLPTVSFLAADGGATDNEPAVQPSESVSDPRSAYLVDHILSDRFARAASFGVDSVLALPFPCAVKTGTSFRFTDNWAVGFTTDYTVAVWVGNFDGTPMEGVSGVSGAGPLFARIMTALYEGKDDPAPFRRPRGLVDIRICALSGKPPERFCPATVVETIQEERHEAVAAQPCNMHTGRGTFYPPPFDGWAREAGLPSSDGPEGPPPSRGEAGPDVAILHPPHGGVFHRLPDLDSRFQSIMFELRNPAAPERVEWLLDGATIAVTAPPHKVLWRAAAGEHRLTARHGRTGAEDSALFTVR